jgi:hypothetical protein
MNLGHAAALALVGWYLMIPPKHIKNLRPTVSAHAPLCEWTVIQPFDKATDCDQELKRRIMDCGNCPLDELWLSAQCIASDDPRLKEK